MRTLKQCHNYVPNAFCEIFNCSVAAQSALQCALFHTGLCGHAMSFPSSFTCLIPLLIKVFIQPESTILGMLFSA